PQVPGAWLTPTLTPAPAMVSAPGTVVAVTTVVTEPVPAPANAVIGSAATARPTAPAARKRERVVRNIAASGGGSIALDDHGSVIVRGVYRAHSVTSAWPTWTIS